MAAAHSHDVCAKYGVTENFLDASFTKNRAQNFARFGRNLIDIRFFTECLINVGCFKTVDRG